MKVQPMMQEDNNKDICSALILYFYLLLQVAVLPQTDIISGFCIASFKDFFCIIIVNFKFKLINSYLSCASNIP